MKTCAKPDIDENKVQRILWLMQTLSICLQPNAHPFNVDFNSVLYTGSQHLKFHIRVQYLINFSPEVTKKKAFKLI